MKLITIISILSAALGLWPGGATLAEEPASLTLWPTGKCPDPGQPMLERALPSRGDNVLRITDISEPSIAVFPAPKSEKPVPAVIICPGGGYGILAYDKEGTEIATWLNSIGITGLVLKYRVPKNREGAFQDLQRAIRLARENATRWNLSANQLGVMGFSAGGHLCARLSTHFDQATYPSLDGADEKSLRPDFTILVYPAYLAQKSGEIAAELSVTAKTPPTFLVHTEDDKSFIAGSKVYHSALTAASVPNEFFLCAKGGHGYGMRSKEAEISTWPKKCQEWLIKTGVL